MYVEARCLFASQRDRLKESTLLFFFSSRKPGCARSRPGSPNSSLFAGAFEKARGVIDEVLRRSALGAASLPIALLERAAALDDPWAICMLRAKYCGQRLAHALLRRARRQKAATGRHEPLTLVGFSTGARLLMHCLDELARLAERADEAERRAQSSDEGALGLLLQAPRAARAASAADWLVHPARLVENAVLLGAPVSARSKRWRCARTVVAGRLVNGFSTRDWMLRLVYRSKAWSLAGVAGAQQIEQPDEGGFPSVENLDLTALVNGHLAYPHVLPQIFTKLRLET